MDAFTTTTTSTSTSTYIITDTSTVMPTTTTIDTTPTTPTSTATGTYIITATSTTMSTTMTDVSTTTTPYISTGTYIITAASTAISTTTATTIDTSSTATTSTERSTTTTDTSSATTTSTALSTTMADVSTTTTSYTTEGTDIITGISTTMSTITTTDTSSTATTSTTTGTYIITATSSTKTTTTTVASSITTVSTTTASVTNTLPPHCNESSELLLFNDICMSKLEVQMNMVTILRNNTNNATAVAYALSYYFSSIANTNLSMNPNYILLPAEIEKFIDSLSNITLIINTNTSFMMVQQLSQHSNVTTLGAAFTHDIGGGIVNTSNENNILNSNITAGAFLAYESLIDVTFLNMLIIDKPILYENIYNTSEKTLASSVIVIVRKRNNDVSTPINISLYFQVLKEYAPNHLAEYFCSFYDTMNSKWNESGCTKPRYNPTFDRYECSCNHLSTFGLVWMPKIITCNNSTHVELPDHSCVSKPDAQALAVNTLRNTTNSTVIANYLSIYISSVTNSNAASNSTHTLLIDDIDMYLSNIKNVSLTINTNNSILIAQPTKQEGNVIVLGASFTHGFGGQLINTSNVNDVTKSNFSAAAIINNPVLSGIIALSMLIIDEPTAIEDQDKSKNKSLASSVIVVAVQRDGSPSVPMNISLYFQVLSDYKPNISVNYFCSFYDATNRTWNESGCTKPRYNLAFDRYECSCNHTTTFALVWLPKLPLTRYLNAQDIASLIFQSISICCFLAIIIHAIFIRIRDPIMSLQANDLLPFISYAVTMILFIFYIALAMTVYTKTTYDDEKQSYNILNHVQNATSPDRSYERMKRCVVILLLSCVTQGVGWLLGPFLTFVSEDRANVLGWFFNIFNGLEGLWGIILYIIILSEHTNKQKAAVATEEPRASRESIYHEYETCYEEDNEKEHCSKKEENEVTYQNTENET
ncbi:unnamed protein product [Rotaria sp. Silwood2]|nr:unnamed protein product [Rotaria sp. Silwood2]